MARRPGPPLPSKERLNELFEYDPERKALIRKITVGGRAKAGSVAGWVDKRGYGRIQIDGTVYPTYRVIFYLLKDFDPGQGRIGFLDGIEGDHPLDAQYPGPPAS